MQTTFLSFSIGQRPSSHAPGRTLNRPFGAALALTVALLVFPLTRASAAITLNGAVTNQFIEGFGVNVNHRSWSSNELAPVLDAFIEQAGMTLFRVVFDPASWEATNDNSNPDEMNWAYYNSVYASAEFEKLWQMCAHLHGKGLSNTTFLNLMGPAPMWMGGQTLAEGFESEWAEMITSLLAYARDTRGLSFQLLAPDNQPDIFNEGVHMSPATYTNALHQLVRILAANGLGDVHLIGPDTAGGTNYLPELMADPAIMTRLAHVGMHSYDGSSASAAAYNYIRASAYPDRTLWVTEFNVWCNTCDSASRGTYDWAYCRGTAEYLLNHLGNGASGGIVWEGYDSFYQHGPATWSFWGLFAVDNENAAVKTYTPRKNFYTVAQISRWVRPGARRIQVTGTAAPFSLLQAFQHPDSGQVTLVGINTSSRAAVLNGSLVALPDVPLLELDYTSATTNLAYGGTVTPSNNTFKATIPADCVFTLSGKPRIHVTLTSPVDGARFAAPASIPLMANASTLTGSISRVAFYSGAVPLGEITNPPFALTWNEVPMGDYALSARAYDTFGQAATSSVVNAAVLGPLAQINVTPVHASVVVGGTAQFTATGADLLGHVLSPQPACSWLASGGGTIDDQGLFTAGNSPGGPFNIIASSGSITGQATITLTATSSGILGNTNEGTLTDNIWSSGAWINAGRFLATNDFTAVRMLAKVAAIPGRYKCAVYGETSSQPGALLGISTEITNPAAGWQTFPLMTSLALTNGRYYWLAIWSDDANARVYFSDTGGALRWGRYDYGPWPDPLATSGGGNYNYCLYAASAEASPTAIALTPTNTTLTAGDQQQFTATGTYSDGSTRDVSSQAIWTSTDPAVATINASGLATALTGGTTTIAATWSGLSAGTPLTVTVPPLAIVETNLPDGVLHSTYSASLTASGGTTPYAWSLVAGTLPAGLGLDPVSGAINGTPTELGTSQFTAQVSDGSSPPQTATRPFTIVIVGETVGAYRSATSGVWTNASTWQTNNGIAWVAAARPPTNAAVTGPVTIRGSHTVTANASVTVDQVLVEPGGQITINSGQTLTIANGAGTDLDVAGTLQSAGTIAINAGATLIFQSGGAYQHNRNGGVLPTASWDANSACLIQGITYTLPGGLGQSFGHFTWNCPGQSANLSLETSLNVAGNFTVAATGTRTLRLSGATTDRTLTVGGNYVHTGGNFNLKNGSATATLNIAGDFLQSGGTFTLRSSSTSGTGTVNIGRNFRLTAGTCNLSSVGAVGTLNVGGNFVHTGGTLTESSSGSGMVVFTAGSHTNVSGGTVANTIHFTVNNGATLQLGTSLLGNGSSGTFTLAVAGTLGIGDPAGISLSGASGNIRVTGTRTFNSGANYVYNGMTSQVPGNGLPATLNNLTIANADGLTLNSTYTVNGICTVTPGAWLRGTGRLNNGPLLLGGSLAPGASAGRFTTAREIWNGGASYIWELRNATGTAGEDWDLLDLTPGQGIELQATSTNPFTLKLVTLNGSTPGFATNFNGAGTYTWTVATMTNATATNFSSDRFAVDSAQFSNDFSGGYFSLELAGGDLQLKFTPGAAALTISTATLPAAAINVPYSVRLAASGGTPPYAWSIIDGAQPPGLTLNSTNGILSGIPGATGDFNFTVQVSDASQPVATTNRSLTIPVGISLTMLVVTPESARIMVGQTQQFAARGTYSDGSTQDISGEVTWTSSLPAVATINTNGLATAVSVGTAQIGASLNGITNAGTLTVEPLPLVISTDSLPPGTVGISYSAALSATGGILPYNWSLAGGILPPGLALNPTNGVIAGTPGTAGTYDFSAQANDASDPPQLASQPLSITISNLASLPGTIGNTSEGTLSDNIWDNGAWINAGRFRATNNGTVTTMFAKVMPISGKYKCAIYTDSGSLPRSLLRSTTEASSPAGGWQAFPLTASLVLTNGQYYWLAIWSDNASARIYYSGTSGTLRWGRYDYDAWPDPVSTSGGGNYNYCIYATGLPSNSEATPEFVRAPVIQSISVADGLVIVRWGTRLNHNYRLQYVENLNNPHWIDLGSEIVGTGETASSTNAIGNHRGRFYRVLVSP
jgi:O-glycosyl hydrolase